MRATSSCSKACTPRAVSSPPRWSATKVIEVNPAAGASSTRTSFGHLDGAGEQEANTVVTVLQRATLIAERVLRPALVTVAAPKVTAVTVRRP